MRHNLIEAMESRRYLAVTASFNSAIGVLTVNGDAGNNVIEVSRNGAGELFVNGGAVPIGGGSPTVLNTTLIVMNGGDGDDTLSLDETNGPLPSAELNGGDDNDNLAGGSNDDTLRGGAGNDNLDGRRGADDMLGGGDADTALWNPGDGSDLVEGGGGSLDALVFVGSNGAEVFNLFDDGRRVRLTRDVGNIDMDVDDTERVLILARGGADSVTVNDLGGTDARDVLVNLAEPPTGTTGDGATDVVNLIGDRDEDDVTVTGTAGDVTVAGFHFLTRILGGEGANDDLVINTGAGDDVIDASALPAGAFRLLTMDGGNGEDDLRGSAGVDLMIGGSAKDKADGNQGADTAFLGGGADEFTWDPGDGSDVIEGQGGFDTLLFNGSGGAEVFDVSANGGRSRFFRNLGNIVMDMDDVERVSLNALGGADSTTVNDLTGTDLVRVDINLAGALGSTSPDGVSDSIVVNGTNGNDTLRVRSGDPGTARITGLHAEVNVRAAEPSLDTLRVNGLGGNDVINASNFETDVFALLHLDGGAGDDELFGGRGDDLLDGGADTDLLDGNEGTDTALNGETLRDIP